MKKTKQRLLRRRGDVDHSRDATPLEDNRPELIVLNVTEREQAADVMTFLATQEGAERRGPVLPTVYELTMVPGPDEMQ